MKNPTLLEISTDIKAIKNRLDSFATIDDLRSFATKDDLKNFATKDDLKNFATKDDLKNFLTKSDAKNFAKKDDINSMIEYMDGFFAPTKRINGLENSLGNHELRIRNLEQKQA